MFLLSRTAAHAGPELLTRLIHPSYSQCREKAQFLWQIDDDQAEGIMGGLITIIVLLSVWLEILALYDKYTPPATPPEKDRASTFAIATIVFGFNSLLFALVVLATNKRIYCGRLGGVVGKPKYDVKAWWGVGIVLGSVFACAVFAWLKIVVNAFLMRKKKFLTTEQWPPAVGLMVLVSPLVLVYLVLYKGSLACCGSKKHVEPDVEASRVTSFNEKTSDVKEPSATYKPTSTRSSSLTTVTP